MRVLITGATGLIGKKITELCHENGMKVSYLSTSKNKLEDQDNYRGFYWNPSTGEIDTRCFERVGTIINLAGANVFQPWTKKAKANILNSRVDSLNLLHKTLSENSHEVGQLISASAVGIYESSFQKMHTEDDRKVDDSFLGKVTQRWEAAADQFNDLGLRVAKVRIGLVLSNKGGALAQMQKPFKYNLGAALGSGKQWQSWIHIEDLSRIFLHILKEGLTGVYNAVAPNPVTNKTLTEQLAKIMGKKTWLPNVPAPVLKISMGEMSQIILSSQLVSSKKINETGFTFHYINLERALRDLLKEKTGA
ncbi:TIGR01777 family oxidoreductase [Salinimicrobium gaetbulicola]|uniref:TIGR01777 family oxidoreductase n=1 Tax=Salinimicrobium gaetbulicola TaxID=999702 RepID=A0ABW3IIR6_9FLAO